MAREHRYCRPRRDPPECLLGYLAKKFTYLSAEEWQQHLAAGHVSVNSILVADGAYVLRQGDMLCFSPPRSLEPPVDEEHLEVLYEDAALLAIAKNGNIPVAEGGRYCENTLVEVLRRRGAAAFYTSETRRGPADLPGGVEPLSRVSVAAAAREGCTNSTVTRHVTAVSPGCVDGADGAAPSTRRRLEGHSPPSTSATVAAPASGPADLFTVHRLDKETSGVVVLAKQVSTAKALASQLAAQTQGCTDAVEALLRERGDGVAFTSADFDDLMRRTAQAVHKSYTAVLRGAAPVGHTFVVVNRMDAMAQHPVHGSDPQHAQLKKLKMCCVPCGETADERCGGWGRVAATRIHVVASMEALGLSCVHVELLTGRSHQIRLHCATIGYPVLGDKLYTTATPGHDGGAVAVADSVYLERVRREDDPFLPISDDNGSGSDHNHGGGGGACRMWCRRHLLHATQLTLPHPDGLPAPALSFTASPLPFFLADVRFGAEADAAIFCQWLKDAVAELPCSHAATQER
ncbi:RNA pseudouridylate synthase-like protein [Novymonas esmeraldas]|uniref:RNA pseudouridylate synthase-like protein n=1 Tax=Novymonas esmeraldas TaxID=1808958 RepID=A0AAW0F7L0_9TRYP